MTDSILEGMSQEPEHAETKTSLTVAQAEGHVAIQIPTVEGEDECLTILLTPKAAHDLAGSVDLVADLIELGAES